jgi:hypothetical protein
MPSWFDDTLAGFKLAFDQHNNQAGIYDPSTGYMFVRDIAGDGSDIALLLTKDRKEVSQYNFAIPNYKVKDPDLAYRKLEVRRLKDLSTGKGLKIGSTVTSVHSLLGKPTKAEKDGKFLVYTYSARIGKMPDLFDYTEKYTFKAGRVIEIYFGKDIVHEGE